MRVILLEKLAKLGKLGDVVNVRDGFARNFLIPQGKARIANKENLKAFAEEKLMFEKREKEIFKKAQDEADKLSVASVSIPQKAGVDGRLFGSVTAADISDAISKQIGLEVKKTKIKLSQPFKSLGEYSVIISLHQDIQIEFAVSVVSE